MKLYTIILLSLIPLFLTAQTTVEEYEYLTLGYSQQIAKSEIPEMQGYYFQDLMNMVDNSGKVRLLYKEAQASVIPIATLFHVNGTNTIYYICLPHEESSSIVFDKFADDLQKLFEADEVARGNYSKIMFRYPKQLQKYYDEILALENGYTTAPTKVAQPNIVGNTKPKSADIVPENPEAQPETKPQETLTNIAKPKQQPKKATKPKATAAPKKRVVIREIVEENSGGNSAMSRGIASAKVRSSLSHRKILYRPEILNDTDKYGVVRVDVCVDAKGQVISVKYNKNNSDTKDEDLLKIAEQLAKKYTFEKSHLSRQCGHIVFKFQFQ